MDLALSYFAYRGPVLRAKVAVVATAVTIAVGAGAWVWSARPVDGAEPVASPTYAVDDVALGLAAQSGLADAAGSQAASSAKAGLDEGVAAAGAVLAGSAGQVADDAVRSALQALLDEASSATEASPARLRSLTTSIVAAQGAVTEAQAQWQSAQAAAAAAAAAAQEQETDDVSSPGSCDTTYSGPAFYTSPPTEGGDGSNGKLPASMLPAISWMVDSRGTPFYLRSDAAAALERLDAAFVAQFGHHLDLDLTHRDYDTQVAMRAALGTVAAVPGPSSHGTGTALDVPELPCAYGYGTAQRDWLVANGPTYGWVSPSWAATNGSNPEYWHFEYRG